MEESKDVEISPSKKVKRSQKDPLTENTPSKKSNGNSSELIPNGTDNVPSEDLTDKDSSHLSPHAASVTLNEVTKSPKTDHTKGKTKSSQKETLKSPGKVSSPLNSPTTSSEGSFHGFEENSVSIKKESEKRKNFLTFLEDIEKKEEASSSQEDEAFIEKAKEEIVDEDMTVDADHASDSDSEQMEIDMGTDSSEKDKACERNKDSDVDVMDAESAKSSGPKMPKRVKKESLIKTEVTEGESQAPILEATLQGSEPVGKIEYCGSCGLKVDDAEDGICCDGSCERWFHLRCSGLTQAEYDELSNDANANWACPKCSGKPSPVPVPVPVANAKPLINVRKDLTNPPTPTATTKRKSIVKEGKTPKIDVSNPAYLKPFDYGWKRELVYRSTSDATPTTKRQGDIYYYTPKGKKLRSLREISDHLAGSDLTMDNFTFWKEPLGMDDPEKEIIRDAKYKLANKDPNASPAVTKKATPKITKATKTTTPKLTATVTPMDSSGATAITPKASASVTPRIVFKGKPSLGAAMKSKVVLNKTPAQQKILPGKEKKKKDASDDELEMGMLPPMWEPSPKSKDTKLGTRPLGVCSISCLPAMGTIPTLRCVVCLCLYHPLCVGLEEAEERPIDNYKCKNCQMEKPKPVTEKAVGTKVRISPPPLTPITAVSPPNNSVNHSYPAPPKLQRMTDGKPGFIPRSRGPVTKSTSIVGGVTTWLPPSSTVHLRGSTPTTKFSSSQRPTPPTNAVVDPSSQPVQTLVTIDSKRYVVVPKHNVLSVSPAATSATTVTDSLGTQITTAASDPTAMIATQTYGPGMSKAQSSNTPAFIVSSPTTTTNSFQNPPGVLLVPYITPQTSPNQKEGNQPQYIVVNGPSGLQPGNFIIGNIPQQQQLKLPAVPTSQPSEPSLQVETPKRPLESPEETQVTKKVKTIPAPMAPPNFLQNINFMYTALLQAFQYLKVQELLRCSRVCHLWRDVALHKDLWYVVRMKNSQVKDWEGFANTLRIVGTRHLDLRKILMPDKPEALKTMLSDCAKALSKIHSLIKLDLCRCTSTFLETIAGSCTQLEYISASAITKSGQVNLTNLGKCQNLIELRLKSQGGMELTNIAVLENLTKLKHLSLTTVKNMNEVLQVVGKMPQLESLELGDMTSVKEAAVQNFSQLKKLRRLRLEKGQQDCPTEAILQTISQLPSLVQLELINFDVKAGFEEALGLCSNIKILLIIPTYVTQSATTNHLVIEGVSKLSKTLNHFVWGLTTELLRVTDLFIDQWEMQKTPGAKSPSQKKSTNDSIPILKPSSGKDKKDGAVTQVDVLQLPKLHKVLITLLPNTKIIILKVPFCHTWRQTISGSPP